PLAPERPWPVVVRLSKGVGLPDPVPDVLGFAVRVVDVGGPEAHQDLLLSSTLASSSLPWLPVPTSAHAHAHYSSLPPYRTPLGDGLVWAEPRVDPDADGDEVQARTLDEAGDLATAGRLHIDLGVDLGARSHLLGAV